MHPPPPPYPICQYDGTINDCHTSGRFDPPFSWEMPVPSREYDSCFFSFTFGHVLGLENLHVPIVFILGNVLGLDEWHLPICYQNPPFSWENACTKSGMCCFSVVPLIENSDG